MVKSSANRHLFEVLVTARPMLIVLAILVAPGCLAQDLLGKLQGRWGAWADSTQTIVITGSKWAFSSTKGAQTYEVQTREWVVDQDDGQRQVVHDEVILTSSRDTMVIRIDCACGDSLYMSDGPFPKGVVYRRIKLKKPMTLTPADLEKLPVIDSSAIVKFIPLTYFSAGSTYTDSLFVTGIIREQSAAGFACGVICHSGTMKIEVTKVEKGALQDQFLYAVIPCQINNGLDVGKTVRIVVTQLPADRDIGCLKNIWNTIDSHGVPFYFSEEDHIDQE